MEKKVAIIHTSLVSHEYLNNLFKQIMPEVKVYNIVDDSLLDEVKTNGHITSNIINRMCKYYDAAASLGVDLILNQCSSVGESAEIAAKTVNVPVLRVDEPMAKRAVELGTRIGVVATVDSTVAPSCNIVKRKAAEMGKQVEIVPYLVHGAMDVLMKEGQKRHNELVLATVKKCAEECDVIVLAQGSMVVLLPELTEIKKPVLTSPKLAVETIRKMLYND